MDVDKLIPSPEQIIEQQKQQQAMQMAAAQQQPMEGMQ